MKPRLKNRYLYAARSPIRPKNITAAARISHGRFGIYLTSIQLADDFVQKYPEIAISDRKFKACKLIHQVQYPR